MARKAAAGHGLLLRAWARSVRGWLLAFGLLPLLPAFGAPAAAQGDPVRVEPVKGEATFSAPGGFARLVLKFEDEVATDVVGAGQILVIRFNRPVDVPIEGLGDAVPPYVSSVRRDPDGTAIRMSLVRKVTVSTMAAGERVFIDMLPDGWKGPPPSLPADVVRELAERARAAERVLRLQRAAAEAQKHPPIRVRALVQPTFVRFVFEMPDGIGGSSVLNDQKLIVQFSGMLNFDLADAKVAAPPNVASINQKVDAATTSVEIALIGDVNVHAFREEKNYIVDVAFQQPEKPKEALAAEASHGAKPAGASADKPVTALQISPPTSESIARQMNMASPQEAPAKAAAASEAPKTEAAPAPAPQIKAEAKPEPKAEAKPEAKVEVNSEAKPEARPEMPPEAKPEEVAKAATETPKAEPRSAAPPPAGEGADAAMKAPDAAAKASMTGDAGKVEAIRDSEGLRLTFSFASATPAASFRRGDTVWLVFDAARPLDLEPIRSKSGTIIGDVALVPLENGQALRIHLNRPLMPSLISDERASGTQWTLIFADKVQNPPQPLALVRNVTDPAHANVAVSLSGPGRLHRLVDPDAGDTLLVVTAPPPVRGFIKRQDFVDFAVLDSAHGVAIRPNSDDVAVELAPDKIIVGRPGGLTLSSVGVASERAPTAVRPLFDIDDWHKNQTENFIARKDALIAAAAAAEPEQRAQARLEFARFYMARGLYQEARGVANLIVSDGDPRTDQSVVLMIHAIASILMGRPDQGLKDLANPAIGNNYDSQLWKGLAFARQARWADAREKFKNVEFAIASLPLELQRIVTLDAMRASLEVKDFAGASKRRAELDVVGVPADMKPQFTVLRGRLAEALGQDLDALDDYTYAIKSPNREAAAEAKQLEVALKQRRNEINQTDALHELEILALTWRGDAIELRTLQMLSQIYSDTAHYFEALAAARQASKLAPNSEISRQAQDAASDLFSDIFLSAKGDELPPIEALGLFYEYRELTPIGRRGDEMIRRLSDRLVAVDLLDQAAELLQYQVDKRLEGAARAQVAARLAMVYLTNRKPDRAIAALRSTRIADLNGELRQQRLLLEARAQSDVGRHDLALDIVSNISGREAMRLRSDIYWAARRWREASEQIELYYGDRFRDFKPLNAAERSDILRAVIGYALAEDAIGLARFREKYAPLMTGEADKIAFDVASKPASGSSAEFAQIAKMAASVDTLDGFLREMKARFPDTATKPQADGAGGEHTAAALPEIAGLRRVGATR
ncbi:tetratricopeptide repeat protein [Bradyrhizobium sp.]|uniref:tetratricopeptide repeat protein n=1 Tax=Bradyrhizobium sp. TaxID=376 RepID=UPI002CBBE116|nr:tetratricopeptide repeat protein [Bradyrhizobium sp.]HWX59226.1 tetratricopeptide repeat protein [Bradyrhizobium sp.]